MSMDDYVVGVDGCRAGWLVCRYIAGEINFGVYASFAEILAGESRARVIAIDIPIGLRDDGRPRQCDLDARHLLAGGRASSVFPAPARCLLRQQDYVSACTLSRRLYGKAVSQQAFGLYRKIFEADAVMEPSLQDRVYEVHPEVCFWAVNRSSMRHGKKSPQGYDERRTILLVALAPRIPARDEVRQLGLRVQPDDLLDAAVAALTAHRIAQGMAERLPVEPEFDAKGLRMEMVY
jgi:predicted RNase H-like nuclease